MSGDEAARPTGPSRRTVLVAGGGVLAFLATSGAVLTTRALGRAAPEAVPVARPTARPAPAPAPAVPVPPPPLADPVPGVQLHPADASNLQCIVPVPETGEWFTTQARTGTSRAVDPAGLAVGDIVVSRLAPDGTLMDSMLLPDGGHGMGLVVRVEAGAPVLYTCWFAAGAGGQLYDAVRLPYLPGTASRAAATTIVPGIGFPLDPFYDRSTDAVTLRHQGGGGPEYTRNTWADFIAGDLSRPTGQIATPDSPPTHQGFASFGDRFFFYTGASSDRVGGDPALITEYDWRTGAVVRPPLDASGNSRQPDGTYPGGRMEPEAATIVVDASGAASLLVGVTTGGLSAPKSSLTFTYPLAPA